ncbi:hypothetical protein V1498_16415 [Peribacillus sp. SCS-26]|uniref:hypothetical protein n=1 Tax=Paraperibacillus marinus TaxID=3115295 RepID=UPI003905EBC5
MNKPENQDRISQFMFGRRVQKQEEEDKSKSLTQKISSIDLDKVMNQVDSIMNIYDQVKPAIQQITPIFGIFKKKK